MNEAEFVPETPGEEMTEVLCCCDPDNFIGVVPTEAGLKAGLELRELDGGGTAFDSDHKEEVVKTIPGFVAAENVIARKNGPKTWKTWKKSTQETGGDLTPSDLAEFPSKIEMGYWSDSQQIRIRHGDEVVAVRSGDHDSPASKVIAKWWKLIEEGAIRAKQRHEDIKREQIQISGQFAEIEVSVPIKDNYLNAISFKTTGEWEAFKSLPGVVDVVTE